MDGRWWNLSDYEFRMWCHAVLMQPSTNENDAFNDTGLFSILHILYRRIYVMLLVSSNLRLVCFTFHNLQKQPSSACGSLVAFEPCRGKYCIWPSTSDARPRAGWGVQSYLGGSSAA